MRHRQSYLLVIVLLSGLFWLSSCRSNNTAENNNSKASDPVSDANAIVAETIGHFRTQTYSSTVNIAKVYKNGLRHDDVLRVYSKLGEQEHVRVLMSVKPQGERNKGAGVLAEIRNKEIVSAYRLIPQTKRVVEINPNQNFSSVVIGGLSLQDFQMVQGISPFAEMRVAGREEINGKLSDKLEVIFRDQSQYHHGQLFTTVTERLPVLLRALNKDGVLIKEIVFDKLEKVGNAWVVKQLTAVEKNFDYTSTFNFEDIQINTPIEDSIFTIDFLQKGWQEPPAKGRRP